MRFEPESIPFPFSRLYLLAVARSAFFRDVYAQVARECSAELRSGAVLDVGCGPGDLALRLAELRPGLQVVGIDISADMVRLASRQAAASPHAATAALRAGRRRQPLGLPRRLLRGRRKLHLPPPLAPPRAGPGGAVEGAQARWLRAAGRLRPRHDRRRPSPPPPAATAPRCTSSTPPRGSSPSTVPPPWAACWRSAPSGPGESSAEGCCCGCEPRGRRPEQGYAGPSGEVFL